MKKILKITLVLLLILSLLAAGYWFFFRYRIDLTTGLLRQVADSQLEDGHYSMAIRLYGWANDLDAQDTDTALKLAEAYEKTGNYSKTEKVLVNAIYESPEDQRLYLALSRAYVAQDKLLDAQQMLDSVANEQVRTELNRRRPDAPVISPEGGFYSTYITVEITGAADAVCYYTVDGSYPSRKTDAVDGPVTLPAGETTVCALAVSGEGLVSPASYAGYTVTGVIEEVHFHDDALKAATQELLHRGDRALRTDDLWAIEELTLPQEISDTRDLVHYTGVTKLVGKDLGELDYSFLASMTQLRYLELERCDVSTENLRQIAACANLEVLILADCGLTNVSALGSLQNLRVLDLSDNSVNAIDSLTTLAALDELYLGHNALTGLPMLRGFKALRILDLSYNALTYMGGVSGCPTLERLNVSHNRLTSVTAVSALTNLVWFNGSNNQVEDVSPLAPCTKLEGFVMTDNKLTDVDFLSECPGIKEVNIDYNDVVAVPAFQADCPLETFSAAHNFLEDLSGLAGLPQLTYVNADYNNIRDISVLKDCPALATVNVYGTYIRSGGELEELGIVVNFTPEY